MEGRGGYRYCFKPRHGKGSYSRSQCLIRSGRATGWPPASPVAIERVQTAGTRCTPPAPACLKQPGVTGAKARTRARCLPRSRAYGGTLTWGCMLLETRPHEPEEREGNGHSRASHLTMPTGASKDFQRTETLSSSLRKQEQCVL